MFLFHQFLIVKSVNLWPLVSEAVSRVPLLSSTFDCFSVLGVWFAVGVSLLLCVAHTSSPMVWKCFDHICGLKLGHSPQHATLFPSDHQLKPVSPSQTGPCSASVSTSVLTHLCLHHWLDIKIADVFHDPTVWSEAKLPLWRTWTCH